MSKTVLLLICRRFPIVSGLAVKWDHTRPPNSRVISINLVNVTNNTEDDDDDDDDDEGVDFIEQEDGTRVEIKQRKHELGEPVENVEGGRIFRVVSAFRSLSSSQNRSRETTWPKDTMALRL